jgi:EAL domain-containing protein (putative c-di-GMP-specific phosphodiesterase class I)
MSKTSDAASASASAKLREQRDRFIAFAFAGAEILIEIDTDQVIRYCAGASDILLGTAAEDLVGSLLVDMIAIDDQVMFREVLHRVSTMGRMDRMQIQFQVQDRPPLSGLMSAITFPNRPNIIYLTISRAHGGDRSTSSQETHSLPRNSEEFAKLAERRVKDASRFGEDIKMTLFDLGAPELTETLDKESTAQFMQGVQSTLRAWSISGNSVGMLDGKKFGILHDRPLDTAQVTSRIADIATLFDPSADVSSIKAATMDLAPSSLTEDDFSKALVYTLNRYVAEGGETFAVRSITEGYQEALDETLTKVSAFRQSLTSDSFTLVFQPIVHLDKWRVHHYEALARMRQGEKLFLPARFIGFAEEFGVVNEFDMMVLRKATDMLRHNRGLHSGAEIAVNLSGKSLSSEAFVQQLLLHLVQNRDLLPRLMFEVTESSELKDLEATNKVLQKIRSFGCKISIDDFGAGSAAFSYLKMLEVDFVKIDGSYILDAFRTRHGRPFLRAIAQLSHDMGLQTIGEMVEDQRTMALLQEVNVDYGQGYFFGRPMEEVVGFQLAAKPARRTVAV